MENSTTTEAKITLMEVSLLREMESHQGRMIVANPFWAVRILLARELQVGERTVKALREAIAKIKRGQHTSLKGAHSVDDVLVGYLT